MSEQWDIQYETPSDGTTATRTDTGRQTLLALHWAEAEVTLRRRAPHEWLVRVPRWSHHRVTDFTSGREIRILRNGVNWLAGIIDAASLPGGRRGEWLEVRGWGNQAILMFSRNSPYPGFTGVVMAGGSTDLFIGARLDVVEHNPGTDWFASADRDIDSGTIDIKSWTARGSSPWETILQLADAEGWAVRTGVASDGDQTIAVGASVEQDLTTSIHLIDGANCEITDDRADGSQLVTHCYVAARVQPFETAAATTALAGYTGAIAVDSVDGLEAGDTVFIRPGEATEEQHTISSVTLSGALIDLAAALGNNLAIGDVIRLDTGNGELERSSFAGAAAAVSQAHHEHYYVVWNDQLAANDDLRAALGEAVIAAYDHVLRTTTVTTTDPALIGALLDAGAEPGDSVTITSHDPHFSVLYSATTVQIQEMRLTLDPAGCRQIDLTLGDPALDALAVLERSIASARNGALAGGAPG